MGRDLHGSLRTRISVYFLDIFDFATLVAADVSGTPPTDSKVFVGVFGMFSGLIGAPVAPPATENPK